MARSFTSWNKMVARLSTHRKKLFNLPWFQGVILLACVVIAMLLANLPATRDIYFDVLEMDLGISLRTPDGASLMFPVGMTVEKFINDILMVIFFFTVGLEIKREIVCGELSSPKRAMMPVIAAFGGVVFPALIFTFINHGTPAASGWGIPTATDIAFAVGILAVLGDRVPVSLKVFLTALAIADDLIAILVVALFYGGTINFLFLGLAAVVVAVLAWLNISGEKRPWIYFIPAVFVWILFYYSGIHATMSGVVMALLIPMRPRYSKAYYLRKRAFLETKLTETDANPEGKDFPDPIQRIILRQLSRNARESIGLSYRLEHTLAPWVSFVIMPIFALANAGVRITDDKDRPDARRGGLEKTAGRRLSGRHRLHDVYFRRYPVFRRSGRRNHGDAPRYGQSRGPDGFALFRNPGVGPDYFTFTPAKRMTPVLFSRMR